MVSVPIVLFQRLRSIAALSKVLGINKISY